jgi:hypothetical protein
MVQNRVLQKRNITRHSLLHGSFLCLELIFLETEQPSILLIRIRTPWISIGFHQSFGVSRCDLFHVRVIISILDSGLNLNGHLMDVGVEI